MQKKFFFIKKSDLNKKNLILFNFFLNHDFFQPCIPLTTAKHLLFHHSNWGGQSMLPRGLRPLCHHHHHSNKINMV